MPDNASGLPSPAPTMIIDNAPLKFLNLVVGEQTGNFPSEPACPSPPMRMQALTEMLPGKFGNAAPGSPFSQPPRSPPPATSLSVAQFRETETCNDGGGLPLVTQKRREKINCETSGKETSVVRPFRYLVAVKVSTPKP